MKILMANSVSILCVLIAGFMAYNNIPWWGWFLVIAVLFGHSFENDCDCKENEN